MSTEITAYLCCKEIDAISVIPATTNGISVNGNEIIVSLVPTDGCDLLFSKIEVLLEPDPIPFGHSVYYCKSHSGDYLSIAYPTGINREYPEFTAKNGNHCHWFATQILGSGPPRCSGYGCLFVETTANSGGKEIPEKKEDVFPNLDSSNTHQMTNNQISPGMLVSVRHYFFDGTDTVSDSIDSEYYTSNTFTGGKVTAINGDQELPNVTYDVSIEGHVITCRPSDWVKWAIDDWVIILKNQNIIVPMQIGWDGA